MTDNNRKSSSDKDHSDKRGFASMPHEKVQEIARKGGEASHKNDDKRKDDNKNNDRDSKK